MMCRALTGRAVAGAAHPPLRLLAAGEPTQPCVRHLSWYHFLLFVQFQLRAAALLPFCFPSKALQLVCRCACGAPASVALLVPLLCFPGATQAAWFELRGQGLAA